MAVSVDGGRGDRRKPLSADLNLVAYIDLLTCMVAFLLITAVWTQLARLPVQQKGQGESGAELRPPETKIAVLVHQDGFSLMVNQEQQPIAEKGDAFDYERLTRELKGLKQSYPDKTDVQVASEDAINFDTLIKTMDAVLASGFPDVSLLDAASGRL
jgi:biopolymer transport protein ExbD